MTTFIAAMICWIAGVVLGTIIERQRKKQVDENLKLERSALRAFQYTGQLCVQCGNGKVYPAACDSCGASWIADMHLEGSPRKQSPKDTGFRRMG